MKENKGIFNKLIEFNLNWIPDDSHQKNSIFDLSPVYLIENLSLKPD